MINNRFNNKVAQIFFAYTIVAILGLIRDITLSFKYGTTVITDAFMLSATLETVLFVGISTSVLQAFIPLYFENNQKLGQGNRFTISLFTRVTMVLICYGGLLLLSKNEIANVAGMYVSEYGRNVLGTILFGMFIYGALMPSANICVGYLRCKSKFFLSGLIFAPGSISIIIGIFTSSPEHLEIISYGYIVGIVLSLTFGFAAMLSNGLDKYKNESIRAYSLKPFGILLFPLLLRDILVSVNSVVSQMFASTLDEGTIASLGYASKLITLVTALFISVITIVLLPMLSKFEADEKYENLIKTFASVIVLVETLIIPLSAFMILFREPIISLLFKRGAFGDVSLQMTSEALMFYSVGIGFLAFNNIVFMLLLTKKTTKLIFRSSLITIVSNLILCWFLFVGFKGNGIALASSISFVICSLYLFYILRKFIDNHDLRKLIVDILTIVAITVVSSGIIGLLLHFICLRNMTTMAQFIVIIIGAVLYTLVQTAIYRITGNLKQLDDLLRTLKDMKV